MSPERQPAAATARPGVLGAALALIAFVFSLRLWLVLVWGSPVPFWDQWDAEALSLFRPWLNGTLRWSDLFTAHNEHRIALTRIADLALLLADGRWNMWWQLLLNAALHATTAGALLIFLRPDRDGPARVAWLLGLAILFAVPSGWQNALWGFQSQVYFASLLAVLSLGWVLAGDPFRVRWWLGWFSAVLALFAIGSGVLTAATALVVGVASLLAARAARPRGPHSGAGAAGPDPADTPTALSLLAIFAILALGWFCRVEVAQHAPLRAHSLAQFGAVFVRCLGWPWVNSSWLWLVLQAPLAWFTVRLIRRRLPLNGTERLILGLGLLAGLHAAAVAYSRGAGLIEARPLSRYQDPLLIGTAANLMILLQFAPAQRTGRIATMIWLGVLGAGLITLTTSNLALNLPYKRAQDNASLAQIRTYLTTHDATVFTRDPDFTGPHPNPAVVRRVLDDPVLRPILPVEFSDPSRHPPWLIEFSPGLVLLSVVGLAGAAMTCFRPKPR